MIDCVILGNIYGDGGFIYNESLIFIVNAILPPLIWLLDPWNMIKKREREKELAKGDKSLLT
jgi:hypothetical protein